MNFIALTGSDAPAMARAAEILLDLCELEQLPLSIALHVSSLQMATAIKQQAGPYGIGQIWRIGDDADHPHLDHLVDVHVSGLCMTVDPAGFLYGPLLALRDQVRALPVRSPITQEKTP